jgi:hypothetical protein
MPLIKVRLAELLLHRGKLALKNPDKKVPASARRLQEPGVDTLTLALYQVQHSIDEPPGGKDLSVVGDALF